MATIIRTAVAHGGDPQDRAALATQAKPGWCEGCFIESTQVDLGRFSSGFNRQIIHKFLTNHLGLL
ncbi:hypothetical protein IQ247_06900 [Plectonema cf. radiosum LEGE 06105]|uniref:Uncharacterized protein n=1 Tax=Plectonema cf. radiosum LEGE 06105 TaxID=945769 RepID=A0A8J7FDV4_9CYAN|nr:hypothetical protein [Plectonema radiosum]MBE9212441.1 hypothetical protein [Plectonema cf. radiosum LEGE 06105]